MRVRFTDQALTEVEQAGRYYGLASEQAGAAFLARLRQATDRLLTSARVFPLIGGRRGGRDIRLLSLDKFPYALVYEVVGDDAVVLALWQTTSRGEDWSRREA